MKHYDQINRNGYLNIKNAISGHELEKVYMILNDKMQSTSYATLMKKFSIPISCRDNKVDFSVWQVASIFGAMPLLRTFTVWKEIEECISDVFQVPARKTADSLIVKDANSSFNSPWHQDSAYDNPHPRELRQLSIWIPLAVDAPKLSYIVGSNHLGKIKHESLGNIMYLKDEIVTDTNLEIVEPELSLGDILVHNRNVIHRGLPNKSNHVHYAITINYEAIE